MATILNRLESLLSPAQPERRPYDPMARFNEIDKNFDMMDETLDYSMKLDAEK